MHVAHYGPLSPHVHQFSRLIARCRPDVTQETCLPGEEPISQPDLVLVHQANEQGLEILRWHERGVPVVGRLWNLRWLDREDAGLRLHCLEHAQMVLGWPCPAPPAISHLPYHRMYPLVSSTLFSPPDLGADRDLPFFMPRILSRDNENIYWSRELQSVLPPARAHVANGWLPPHVMAEHYRRAQVVVCTGLDPYISSSAMEAALCGCLLVVSDTGPNRAEFSDGGARFCTQDPAAILRACADLAELWQSDRAGWRAEATRNLQHFAPWALEQQGGELVSDVLRVAG